jgi:hypothetical protein
MNKVCLHKNISKTELIYFEYLAIMLPILYGFYKNGILLYASHVINLFGIFRPLMFILIPFLISEVNEYFKRHKFILTNSSFYWTCVSLFIPPRMSLISYTIILIIAISLTYYRKLKINMPVLTKLIIVAFLLIVNQYNYSNILEATTKYSFSFLDLIFGRSIGGLCSTSLVYAFICYIILSIKGYYKKEIPAVFMITYFILAIIISLLTKNYNLFTNIAGIILAVSLFGTQNNTTPFMPKARIIYAVFLGFLTIILNLIFNNYEGIFIAIFLANFSVSYIDNLIYGINLKK